MADASPSQTPDIPGALAAGYTGAELLKAGVSPTDLVNALATQKGAPDIAGARKAGYSDEELAQSLTAPATPPPSGSLLNAAEQSILHGAPAGIASGLSGFIRGTNNLVGGQDTGHVADRLDAYAARQNAAIAQNYQAPATAPTSAAEAISGSSGLLDAASRLGAYGVRKAAENVGSLAPNLLLGIAAPETLPLKAGLAGYDYLQNLAGVRGAKQAAGADPNTVSIGDLANAGGQTALMALNPLGSGSTLASRGLLSTALQAGKNVAGTAVDGAAKGAVQAVANDTGAVLQGGYQGQTPLQVASSIGNDALNAGTAGGVTAGGLGIARASLGQVQNALQTRKAGPNMQAYAAEVQPWNDALQSATQRVQQANPGLSPDQVKSQAYQLAQMGTPTIPGAVPPSFDNLSPQAQNGAAELSTLKMYDAAYAASTKGMGRSDATPAPAQVFKNVLQNVTDNLTDTANLAQNAGLLSRDQAGTFKDAIAEARKHNVLSAENGQDFGYFDTLRDQVAQLPLDPTFRTQILQNLRVADIASQASLYKNAPGFFQRNARPLMGYVGGAAGALAGDPSGSLGGILGEMVGSMAGKAASGVGVSALSRLDRAFGGALPDILARRQAIEDYASKNGITPIADPQALMDMNNQLRGLAPAPTARPVPQPVQNPASGAPTGPVTSPGRPYTPAAPNGPVAPPQGPIGPSPAPVAPTTSVGLAQAPAQPVMGPRPLPQGPSPVPVAPVTAAQRLAAAPTVAPVAAPAPQPVAPASGLPSINQALVEKAQRLSQAAQQAFPSERRGWSAAIADQTGVQHGPMLDAIKAQAANSPELAATLQGHTIPIDTMRAITNHVADLRDAGKLPLANQAAAPAAAVSSPVRNPLSYRANLEQEAKTAENIVDRRPDLSGIVDRMRDPLTNGKTAEGRGKVLDSYLAGLPSDRRASVERILRPLAGYGRKS